MTCKAVIISLVAGVAALEPFVPPIAVQDVMQASLPGVIDIHYDVPAGFEASKGASDADAAARSTLYERTSFLKKGTTDVYFEKPASAAALEQSYQAILSQVKSNIKAKFYAMSGASFLATSPSVNVFVGEGKGMTVDMARLSMDAYAYAGQLMAGLETRSSFLAGDDVPHPLPVLNIDVTTPAFVSSEATTLAQTHAATVARLQSELSGLSH
ncbi:unnamed protein product [Amoebophrya sp. A25]|nr:unnamed protein product [Amoebophrya sp. A25]|eukprot:GSA25T00027306001.1